MFNPFNQSTAQDRPASRFWLLLLTASLLLHLLFIGWANGKMDLRSMPTPVNPNPDATVVTAQFYPNQSSPISPSKPKPRTKLALARTATPVAEIGTPADANTHTVEAEAEPAQPHVTLPEPLSAARNDSTSTASAADVIRYKIDLPPSVELKYDVQALRGEQKVYGSSTLRWQNRNDTYQIDGTANVLFFSVLDFHSSGVLDEFGIAPVLYTEKRIRKSATNTHFHHERNLISFSASTITYPRQGGEQDRASIIWQLAAIGRADNPQFVLGAELNFFVAGVRDGAIWRIQIIGQEQIMLDDTLINTWHLVRIPQSGSYDQQLDIWLAPQYQWYPVRLRYTETNGDYLDMSLSNLAPIMVH